MLIRVLVPSTPAVLVAMAVFGVGFGIVQNATITVMFARTDSAGYGAVSGMWNLAYDAGMGAGAFGFGMLVAQTGYPLGFALLGVLICAAGHSSRATSLARLHQLRTTHHERKTMRKVVLYSLLSLDGVAEEPGNYVFEFDDEMRANLQLVVGSQDAVVLGRRTYDEWAPYWPTSDEEPFAGFINGVDKHVATSSPPADPWANSTVVKGSVADLVRELKASSGGDIGVHGSITLARSLIKAGLIDELRLVITPVVAGSGRQLFDQGVDTRRLQLLDASSTPSGTLLAHYRVDG